ncbi:phage shock protein C (PspC) family protein [Pelagirhabdus alkalitolerans]|uniref:Phage shock protein C (PspC) family protein n=1 Tax=Pelagirhabdus alkalitolerans TaxID=1612202 RepID=A0A1G6MTX0_9BACI|nr:PspC domain-containing protein [Pelagirhabdus alkalitolerans]SDC58979.1 phage shock protein C (PspC) family protein [Pelagirhabdus alkalitolerans]
MTKKLYRSNENVMLAGVLGGFSEYINVDPTIVRILYVIAMIFTAFFPLLFLYIAAAIIIPKSDVYRP